MVLLRSRRRTSACLALAVLAVLCLKSVCNASPFKRPVQMRYRRQQKEPTLAQEAVVMDVCRTDAAVMTDVDVGDAAEGTDAIVKAAVEDGIDVYLPEKTKNFFDRQMRRELLAEFLSTAFLVQLCSGAGFASTFLPGVSVNGIAVTIIAVTVAGSMTSSISGARLNPAMSLAFALIRPTEKFGLKKVIPYSVAQVLGAMLGSSINVVIYSKLMRTFVTKNPSGICVECAKLFGCNFFDPVTTSMAFAAEAFGTAVLAFVVFSITHPKNAGTMKAAHIPAVVSLAVAGLVFVFGPLTQAGFNPARDFGPRLAAIWVAGYDRSVAFLPGWWVYLIAPMIGAPLGAALADKVLLAD